MDAPGYNEPKMGHFVFNEAPKRYSFSHSPDSIRSATTPGTPDDVRTVFGDPIPIPGAQASSVPTTGATAVLSAFTHQPASSLTPANEFGSTAAGSSKQAPGREVPRFISSSFGLSNPSSQIWGPPATRLGKSTDVDKQTAAAAAAHARWGSLDAHMDPRDVFARQENLIARPSPFMANQTRLPMADSMLSRPYNPRVSNRQSFGYQAFAQQNEPLRYNHEAESTPMERHISATSNMSNSSFDLSELQNALLSSACSESATSQPLGIDILRISSPRASPIQQFTSTSLPAQVPVSVATGGFLPMQAVMQQTPPRAFTTELSTSAPNTSKFSTRYHGMHTETNASAEHLAPEENCALWLTNLPPGVTIHQLLKGIRNVGRVWCSYINYPDYVTHQTAAAKVVFFTPEAAQQLLSVSWTRGLFVQGYRVKVSHNRIKYGSHAIAGKMSRVLIITGHAEFVNEATLTKFFKDRFIFQLDEVTELIKAGGRAVMEFKFGSYRCQSQMGKMSLEKDRPRGLEKVEFGDDPCEVGDTMSSYGIAAERIQGRGL
ncbi:uncharacterized protein TrAFT101_002236 [Trichoderma asperellum]|uniref:RRM domain-containing protein n=1 Tax=Trichoderma asperellum (strain ATCC 204424 / CBS 433.97 / NBRC 101777) TaxID=1042311 RepID=A0A2T3ZFU9_TRIA4|nr:hypothetical protein M441DRAFT_377256 [Trichoderma asperellum CBS 433.97]PTB43682.1 hypothetical protein M441DRAFT_377256 [Trichoderma asperellum CBS 433.97]UKZ86402.1 hypothetical protein TrAFT101_002236 [Trichoderma asperellum]